MHEPIMQSLTTRYAKVHEKGKVLGLFNSFGYEVIVIVSTPYPYPYPFKSGKMVIFNKKFKIHSAVIYEKMVIL